MASLFGPDATAERPMWPHQVLGIDRVAFHIAAGIRRVLFQCPTGGGKSRVMESLAERAVSDNSGVSIYTNRRLLMEQLIRDFERAGVPFGVRAADYTRAPHHPVQLCSVQTEHSRVVRRKRWDPHPSGLVLLDEAHVNNNPQTNAVIDGHLRDGAAVVGFTATPVGLAGRYDALVQVGPNSELRDCGALVPAAHFGCEEPDLRHIRTVKTGERVVIGRELTEREQVKAIMTPGVFGRVVDWWRRTNPHGLPSIGFAPGVGESIGFAQAFNEAGIRAAHIDGNEIVYPGGIRCRSTPEERLRLETMSRTGEVRVVWNRFVLREGISWNWLAHGVMACVFGTLTGYLQSGGRLLRAHPGLTRVTVQDHGGNWWRHGSLNADREWDLGDTPASVAGRRWDLFDPPAGTPPEPQPFLCPACRQVLAPARGSANRTVACPGCGAAIDLSRRGRPVVQADGSLVEHPGDAFPRRRVDSRPDTEKLWRSVYFRALKSKRPMTFKAALGLFVHEHGYRPVGTLGLMPVEPADWYRNVSAVPRNRLRQAAPTEETQ